MVHIPTVHLVLLVSCQQYLRLAEATVEVTTLVHRVDQVVLVVVLLELITQQMLVVPVILLQLLQHKELMVVEHLLE